MLDAGLITLLSEKLKGFNVRENHEERGRFFVQDYEGVHFFYAGFHVTIVLFYIFFVHADRVQALRAGPSDKQRADNQRGVRLLSSTDNVLVSDDRHNYNKSGDARAAARSTERAANDLEGGDRRMRPKSEIILPSERMTKGREY